MTVHHSVVTYSGFVMSKKGNSPLVFEGSGFFVFVEDENFSFTYFVTCAHVVWVDRRKRNSVFEEGETVITVNDKNGEIKPITVQNHEWIFHPDRYVDLCAVCLDDQKVRLEEETNASVLNVINLAASNRGDASYGVSIMLGDKVFIVGAFLHRLGNKRNIPIVRVGHVAALDSEPIEYFSPRGPAYLIETRSLGGISGSPVFFDPASREGKFGGVFGPFTTTNVQTGKSSNPTMVIPYRLMGMVLGTWYSTARSDFIEQPRALTDAEWNTGISVVMPDSQILEFLMSPKLKQQRFDSIDEREKRSGVRFTSAASIKSQAVEAEADIASNPEHREDFTRLVAEASKKRAPSPGT